MRICIVTVAGWGIGGMQDHTRDLAASLVSLGNEVDVISGRHPEGVKEARRDGAVWRFLDADTRLPRTPLRHPRWLRRSAEEFEHLHALSPYDIVHSESTSALGLLRRGVHRRVPLVVKFHGNYVGLARAALRRAAEERTRQAVVREAKHVVWISLPHSVDLRHAYRFRSCEAMVVSRQQLEDTRRSLCLDRSRIHVVPNGVDTTLFAPRPRETTRARLGLGSEPLFVCVGRLNREKGVDLALRALARLNRNSDARLAVVGDGEERKALEGLVAELGIGPRVLFAGSQPREIVATYLSAADAFLFPTVRDEAAPLVLPQAMSAELPVIASSVGGITEVVDRPGQNGILIQAGDVDALTREMASLLENPSRRLELGRQARKRILDEYTLELMTERTLGVYRLAAAKFRSPA